MFLEYNMSGLALMQGKFGRDENILPRFRWLVRLGGPDPLDYISMYGNPGNPAHNIPAHWHYVSFGLSDLHGDGRVHE